MKTYHITALDHTGPETLDKRLEVRPDHLAAMQKLKATGNFILGGAFLNDAGQMIGSALILQFSSDEEMELWKQNDPYTIAGVWNTIEVRSFKIAAV